MGIQKVENIGRDYDKEPIVIVNYAVLFERYLIALLLLVSIPLFVLKINRGIDYENNINILLRGVDTEFITIPLLVIFEGLLTIYLIYITFFEPRIKFKDKKSFFVFKDKAIKYIYEYLTIEKDKVKLCVDIDNIQAISYCIVCELPESYGRWHYLSSWQLYRKSSIGVHIGKATLFIRYLLTYAVFIFPQKLWRLYSTKEPYFLLKKNLFIQFKNRNYFLVNIYSQKELDELLEYFQKRNIPINQKTYFIPHLQNQGWFVDREEVWAEDFNIKQGEK